MTVSKKISLTLLAFVTLGLGPDSWGGASVSDVSSYTASSSQEKGGGAESGEEETTTSSKDPKKKKKILLTLKGLVEDNPVDTSVGVAAGVVTTGAGGLLSVGGAALTALAPTAKSVAKEVFDIPKKSLLQEYVEGPLKEATEARKQGKRIAKLKKEQEREKEFLQKGNGVSSTLLDLRSQLETREPHWGQRLLARADDDKKEELKSIDAQNKPLKLRIAHGESLPLLKKAIDKKRFEIDQLEKRIQRKQALSKEAETKEIAEEKDKLDRKKEKLALHVKAYQLHKNYIKEAKEPTDMDDSSAKALFERRHEQLERMISSGERK